jgi:hypothetical protein
MKKNTLQTIVQIFLNGHATNKDRKQSTGKKKTNYGKRRMNKG